MQCGLFENEIGPGVFQVSAQQTSPAATLPKVQTVGNWLNVLILTLLSGIPVARILLGTGLEHSRFNLVFEIRNSFIFRMLYCLNL